ncbi:hypothetical protein FVE85_9718 [Porphyridium purpureum]|uniref:SnoaL-like domain-containing protein n=1 Tax=Porphyridium purpureum TaxID=35688 RepID=A0A5J4YJP4_PORPP|nr:hypothetical protein FVE85_9718 [Porphyridium purpureum]|eukprot:POR4143..scf246_12
MAVVMCVIAVKVVVVAAAAGTDGDEMDVEFDIGLTPGKNAVHYPSYDKVVHSVSTMDKLWTDYLVDGVDDFSSVLAPGARLNLFGVEGIGREAADAYVASVRAQLVEPGARVQRVFTRIKDMRVSLGHFEATHLALWRSKAGGFEWVASSLLGRARLDGKIEEYSIVTDIHNIRELFETMNGYMAGDEVAKRLMLALQARDPAMAEPLLTDNVSMVVPGFPDFSGKDAVLAYIAGVDGELMVEATHVWSSATSERHPIAPRRIGPHKWSIIWDSFHLLKGGCYTYTGGLLVVDLDARNKVTFVNNYIDFEVLAMRTAKCQFLLQQKNDDNAAGAAGGGDLEHAEL